MQTYTFDDLSDRAKQNVRRLYLGDVLVSWPRVRSEEIMEALELVSAWLFTEHGERVA